MTLILYHVTKANLSQIGYSNNQFNQIGAVCKKCYTNLLLTSALCEDRLANQKHRINL